MTAPVNPPTLCPPFVATTGDSVFWPPSSIERKRSNDLEDFEAGSNAEIPSIKKPRNLVDGASNLIQNLPFNPRIPLPNPLYNNKGIGRLFFKTKICARFNLGICPYGSTCNFAHGPEEIRRPPPNWQDLVAAQDDDRAMRNWGDQQRTFNRFKICKKFYNGEECPYGERCLFVHESPEMYRESVAISIGTTASTGSNEGGTNGSESNGILICGGEGNSSNLKPVFWKTRMCNKWETTGHCHFGEKCHFAHGLAELKKSGEAENGNPGMAASKALLNSTKNISQSNAAASCKQQVEGKKCFAKWKGPEKISRIYADWIDDMPFVHRSPNKVES